MDAKKIKLNLGCGSDILDGWINIDSVKEFNPDMVLDISRPLPFEDMTVDEICAQDLLEHFDKYLRYIVFYEWVRVLKIKGTIHLQVPNFKKILFRYFKFGYEKFVDFIFGENMLGANTYIGQFGNHKWGYSPESLKEFASIFGIETSHMKCEGLNIIFTGRKHKHVSFDVLKDLQIFSHANGGVSMSLGEAKKKIDIFFE